MIFTQFKVASFFDELVKISADLGFEKTALTANFFKSPMAQSKITTFNAGKGLNLAARGDKGAQFLSREAKVNHDVRALRSARATPVGTGGGGTGGAGGMTPGGQAGSSIMEKVKARKAAEAQRAAQQAAARSRSMQGSPLGAGQFQTPASMGGRAQVLSQMKQRVNPALESPQVAQARAAEHQARSGALQRTGRVNVQ